MLQTTKEVVADDDRAQVKAVPAAVVVAVMVLGLGSQESHAAPLRGSQEDVERVLERVDDVLNKEMDILSNELLSQGAQGRRSR